MAQKYIVGDLVKVWLDLEIKYQVAEVVGYNPAYQEYLLTNWFIEDTRGVISVTEDRIMPIPLTPEILEKNGWEKEVMSRGVKNSHWVYTKPDIEEYGYFPIYIEKGIGDEFDVYPFTDNNVCKQIAYIKYVHELQHLLFGLGLNSEMEV